MSRRSKKQREAYRRLLNSPESLRPGNRLPVHELPEVQSQQKKEYKKRASLFKRISESAIVAYHLALPYPVFKNMSGISDKARLVKEAKEYKRTGRGNELAHLAVGRLVKIDERRRGHWKAAGEKAEAQFRDKHPEIALREAELHTKWEEQQQRKIYSGVLDQSARVMKYFKEKRPHSLLSEMYIRSDLSNVDIESRCEEQAEATLTSALANRNKDGSIPLLSAEVEKSRFKTHERTGSSLQEISDSERAYVQGAASLLWKLGFLDFDFDEREGMKFANYSSRRFNSDIEWGQSEDGQTVTANLEFNQENEFHQMLASQSPEMPPNPQVQVNISQHGMDLRLAESDIPAAAALA